MTEVDPLVSYVVITHDRPRELATCLVSIRQQDYPKKQIVVVDNGSTDRSCAVIRAEFPEVLVVTLPENQGVAGGRNRGAERAEGAICVFVDDDAAFVEPEATRRVVELFRADEGLACVAFRVLDPVTGAEDRHGIPRADKRQLGGDYPCAYFSGAGFALRREIFLEIGAFWEPLFYACEELDFSYRLLDRGYRLLRSGEAAVVHYRTQAGRPGERSIYYNTRNRCWVALRNLPLLYVVPTTGLWWLRTGAVALWSGHPAAWTRGIRDACRGLGWVLRERRPIGAPAIRQLKALSGRLWY